MSGPTSPERPEAGASPLLDRLAPRPPLAAIADRIERHTQPGDVVLDLHGRGGWIAREAVARGRRAISLEQGPLTRLLADLVLRTPDPHHLDAALDGLASTPVGDEDLRAVVAAPFAITCPRCAEPAVAEAFTWAITASSDGPDAEARLVTKHFRCPTCGDEPDAPLRRAPADDEDRERAAATPDDLAAIRERLRARFPAPGGAEQLVDGVLDLHSPRQLAGLGRIVAAIEGDLRAEPLEAALRLALLEAVLPASRLAALAGQPGSLRITGGRVRVPRSAVWIERNPWLAFEDGFASVRRWVVRLDDATRPAVRTGVIDELAGLPPDGSAAVVRVVTAAGLRAFADEAAELADAAAAGHRDVPRARLAIGQPPRRTDPAGLAGAWHGTGWALGREAAASLPIEPLLGPAFRAPWAWQAAALRRGLEAVAPLVDRDGRAVLLVEGPGPEPVVAAALGAAAAGYRLAAAETGQAADRALELVPPGGTPPPGPRTRANVALPAVPGAAGDPMLVPSTRLFAPPERVDARPFSVVDAAHRVNESAVAALVRRGEPADFDTLLGEILIGLDRAGLLRRLASSQPATVATEPDDDEPDADFDPGPPPGEAAPVSDARAAVAGRPRAAVQAPPDQVGRLLSVVREELARTNQRRVVEIERDTWWLGVSEDLEEAATPLADRLEWSTYSLLSTGVAIPEARFRERIAAQFSGVERPEPELVDATLASYLSPAAPPGMVVTDEDLVRRAHQHTELLAALTSAGHKLGMHVWLASREHERRVGGLSLGERLSDQELDVYLPRVTRGPVDALEATDVIWYVRDRATFLIEVEWTAMIGDLLRRHQRIPQDDRIVRLLLVPPERSDLVRHKLERSVALRDAFRAGNWHVLKWNHLVTFLGREPLDLGALEPLLGFEPAVEETGEQLPLFDRER